MEEALYAAMAQKSSLRTALSGSYGVEFTVFVIMANFGENGTTMKAYIQTCSVG